MMTDDEIRTSYRQAKYPNLQIEILAQLNACRKDRICKILGLPRETNQRGRYSEALKREVVSYVRAHGDYDDAALQFSVSRCSVRNWCMAAGVALQSRRITREQRQEILLLLERGCSLQEAARRYGISTSSVRAYRKEAGISHNSSRPLIHMEQRREEGGKIHEKHIPILRGNADFGHAASDALPDAAGGCRTGAGGCRGGSAHGCRHGNCAGRAEQP